jgi:hypothetical protein
VFLEKLYNLILLSASFSNFSFMCNKNTDLVVLYNTFWRAYNDIGYNDTSPTELYFLWYQIIEHWSQ